MVHSGSLGGGDTVISTAEPQPNRLSSSIFEGCSWRCIASSVAKPSPQKGEATGSLWVAMKLGVKRLMRFFPRGIWAEGRGRTHEGRRILDAQPRFRTS